VRFHFTSEAAHVLNDDRANTVVFNSIQQCGESSPVLDRIRPADSGIIELADKLVPLAVGEAPTADR
jgi:hypothetical protein